MNCLVGTFWYVPTAFLTATLLQNQNNTLQLIPDQTVWEITGQRLGYFWGRCAVSLNYSLSYQSFVGTISPAGQVLMQFTSFSNPDQTVQGQGQLMSQEHKKFFQMQVSDNAEIFNFKNFNISHWANMLPIKPSDGDWHCLPGTNQLSVPQMLANCPPAPKLIN